MTRKSDRRSRWFILPNKLVAYYGAVPNQCGGGRECGVGRRLGMARGVTPGVAVAVAVGEDVGVVVGKGVAVGVDEGIDVGVGESPWALVIRYNTLWSPCSND
jgi:hypothetical protein